MDDPLTAAVLDLSRQVGSLTGVVGEMKGKLDIVLGEREHASASRAQVFDLHRENQAEIHIAQQSLGRIEDEIKNRVNPKLLQVDLDIAKLRKVVSSLWKLVKGLRLQMGLAATAVGGLVGGSVSLIGMALSNWDRLSEGLLMLLRSGKGT